MFSMNVHELTAQVGSSLWTMTSRLSLTFLQKLGHQLRHCLELLGRAPQSWDERFLLVLRLARHRLEPQMTLRRENMETYTH